MAEPMKPSRDIERLIEIMAALRTPVTGCPWDLAQNFETIAPYTLEEAYEVADAIERGDLAGLKDELGDLLLQVVYHARMAEEIGAFSFGDVVEGVTRKMIRRHPHVFGDVKAASPADVDGLWARIKAEEKAEKPATATPSLLADIPVALPALSRAIKLQDKAARVGFDWPNLAPVFEKLKEELAELEEVALPHDPRSSHAKLEQAKKPPFRSTGRGWEWGEDAGDHAEISRLNALPAPSPSPTAERASDGPIKEEFGDLLFVMANVARHLKIDPEAALRSANQKFICRFGHIERRLSERGSSPALSTLEEMDALWDEAKAREKNPSGDRT